MLEETTVPVSRTHYGEMIIYEFNASQDSTRPTGISFIWTMLLDAIAHPTDITDLRWLHHDHVLERLDYTCTVRESAHRLSSMFADLIEDMQGLFQSALASLGGSNINDHLYELSASHTYFMLFRLWQEESQTTCRARGKPAVNDPTRAVLCYRLQFPTHFVSFRVCSLAQAFDIIKLPCHLSTPLSTFHKNIILFSALT